MPKELIDSILELISSLVPYELGSTQFYVVLAASVLAWLAVARVMMGLMQTNKGFFEALLALVCPIVVGLLAYGLVDWQVVPQIEAEWVEQYLALGVMAAVALLVVLLLSKRFIVLGAFMTLIIFVLASAAAVGAYFATNVALVTIDKGSEQIKQHDERNQKEIDSVL